MGWLFNPTSLVAVKADIAALQALVATKAALTVAQTEVFVGASPIAWTDLDLSGTIGANSALVLLKFARTAAGTTYYAIRKNGDVDEFYSGAVNGCATGIGSTTLWGVFLVATDANGVIEWKSGAAVDTTIDVITYIK